MSRKGFGITEPSWLLRDGHSSRPMNTASAGDSLGPDGSGRRRYLTLLFSDLSDSTFLSGILEAEHYAQMLSDLRQCFRDIVPKHGGQIARIQGDGVLAIFGFPQAREDDGRRATETALELHEAVGRVRVEGHYPNIGPLMLHSGIHGGLVFVAEGDLERGRFELLGTVPNMAARLSGLAQRGEICVSEETLGADTNFFTTTGPQTVAVDGSTNKMRVYRVLGQAPVQSRLQARAMRGLTPFVGRTCELETLEESFSALVAGDSPRQCVAISGGPGLGKTRLIEEFLHDKQASSSCLVLRGYCESYLTAEPLQPFLQMLRALFGLEPGMSGVEGEATARIAWAKVCPAAGDASQPLDAMALVGAGVDARPSNAGGALSAVRALFDVLAACRPLLIVVDDWQWADDASQETLAAIRTLQRPILVVVAHRMGQSDVLDLSASRALQLEPLELAEASHAMARLLPGADPFMVAEIHRYAGGNPLFMEELCHAAGAEGGSRQLERRLGGAWLNALIESRVGRLPEEQASVVRAAAVMGNAFPVWLFESITGHGADDPLVRALAEQDFLFPGEQAGTMRFKHGIARDVVYDTIGLHQRKRMHLRVAAAIDNAGGERGAEDYCEALAYHFAAGGLHAEAARYAELAGDKAMLAPALDRARTQYGAALEALDALLPLTRERQLRWCALAQKIGMVCVYDPLALTDGVELLSRSVELARQSGDTDAIARSEYWLGYTCYSRGRTREAIAHLEDALAVSAGTADSRLVAQIQATLGQALAAACEYDRALVLLDGAVEAKRRHSRPGSHVAVGSAYTLSCKGAVLGDRGQFLQAHECFLQALSLLGDSPHQVGCSVRGWISTVYQWQGRWQEALDASEQAARMAEQMRSRHLLAMSRALSGFSTWVITGKPASIEAIRTATSWIEARDGAFFTSLNYGWLVQGSSELELDDQARRHAARLFVRARLGDRVGEALGCRALARRAAKSGRFGEAERYLGRAFASAERRASPHERAANLLCRAETEAMHGAGGRVVATLDEACEAFESMGMRWHAEQAQILRGRL